MLRRQFGRHCEVLGEEPDGRAQVRLAAHLPLSIAERMAGWGETVEVVESDAVRTELARIGAELRGATADLGDVDATSGHGDISMNGHDDNAAHSWVALIN